MKRKGQAAMEFLMTYGWAILAAIIVIGVLAIYFRPSSIAPDAFILEAPFTAGAMQATASDNVILELTNNGGINLNINAINVSVTSPTLGSCYDTADSAGIWTPGVQQTVTFTGASECAPALALNEGDQFRADIRIFYNETGSSLEQVATGSITYTVIA